jgi:hypothetical protein
VPEEEVLASSDEAGNCLMCALGFSKFLTGNLMKKSPESESGKGIQSGSKFRNRFHELLQVIELGGSLRSSVRCFAYQQMWINRFNELFPSWPDPCHDLSFLSQN